MPGGTEMDPRGVGSWMFAAAIGVVVLVVVAGSYLGPATTGQTSSTTGTNTGSSTTSGMQGIVAGYVTVGPSQPVCSENMSCNVNMSGYSIIFTPQCIQATMQCQPSMAPLSPSGHYSILLQPGNYSVTGLSPSCQWMGCSAAFPKNVTVEGGMQVVLDFNIDTGIR